MSGPKKQMENKSGILLHGVVIKNHWKMERFWEVETGDKALYREKLSE